MEPIEVGKLDELLDRATNLMNRVEDTYLVAKDILMGTQISDWIADLKASGTASATYGDSSRMNVLIANEDAANNSDVAKYLVQWAVANNKFGTYCGAACGAVSGVTWDSLTTPNAVMGNAAAFTALCGNSVAIYEVLKVKACKQAIWANLAICDTIIRSSDTASSALEKLCSRLRNSVLMLCFFMTRFCKGNGLCTGSTQTIVLLSALKSHMRQMEKKMSSLFKETGVRCTLKGSRHLCKVLAFKV